MKYEAGMASTAIEFIPDLVKLGQLVQNMKGEDRQHGGSKYQLSILEKESTLTPVFTGILSPGAIYFRMGPKHRRRYSDDFKGVPFVVSMVRPETRLSVGDRGNHVHIKIMRIDLLNAI
jgi:hypothetical protein